MPINYTLYPKNWFTEIRPAILKRANWCCENCGLSNGVRGYRDERKVFIECDSFMEVWAIKNEKKIFRIVLTIAHLDHNVENNTQENLKALCQKCHLNYDSAMHILKRKLNAAKKNLR